MNGETFSSSTKIQFFAEYANFARSKLHDMDDKRLEAFKRLLDIMDELRAKCPWDREQTFESLRNNTIEETYELVDAITDGDLENVKKELGDLMLHVVFYSKMGDEKGVFNITDVLNGICDKLVFRHPHVFGSVDAENSEQVKQNWEQLKLKERKAKRGILAGVPRSLPAMVKAYRIGEKAAAAGFDWNKKEDVWAKVREEEEEVETEIRNNNCDKTESEIGDLFFALVNMSRLYGIDPEMALERSNKKFIARFEHIEQRAQESGRNLKEMTLEEMDQYWNEAKRAEK